MSSQLPLLPFDSLELVACQFLVFVSCVCPKCHLIPAFHRFMLHF